MFSGRTPSEHLSRLTFWVIFLGFNLTFLPMHVTGLLGMPRRVYIYAPGLGWELLNLVSIVVGLLFAAGVGMFIVDFALHFLHGRQAPRNPWNAGTLDWALKPPFAPHCYRSAQRKHQFFVGGEAFGKDYL